MEEEKGGWEFDCVLLWVNEGSLILARSHTHMYARVHMPNFGASNRFIHMNARAHTLQS